MVRSLVCLALLGTLAPASAAPPRTQTGLACESVGPKLECVVVVRTPEGGAVTGATVTLGASNATVPSAPAVRPVTATAGQKPGEYRGALDLGATGVYAVLIDIAGPVRDRLVRSVRVEPCAASKRCPAAPVNEAPPARK